MNRERVDSICKLLVSEKALAADERDLFLVRQLGTMLQTLSTLIKRDESKETPKEGV